jgi:hypothetical protein
LQTSQVEFIKTKEGLENLQTSQVEFIKTKEGLENLQTSQVEFIKTKERYPFILLAVRNFSTITHLTMAL